jgi:hypothetical protein
MEEANMTRRTLGFFVTLTLALLVARSPLPIRRSRRSYGSAISP